MKKLIDTLTGDEAVERVNTIAQWLIVIGMIVAAVIASMSGKAHASEVMTTQCTRGTLFYPGSCTTTVFDAYAGPRIIDARHPIDEAKDKEWVAYCQPTFRTGRYGVVYYVYKHEGCEYGKSN